MREFIPTFMFKMNSVFKNAILFCLLLLFSQHAIAQVNASVNQSSYFQGDPITLTLETDNNIQGNPDLSPLQKNFDIKGTSTSARTNYINGRRSFSKSWRIQLHAKKSGVLIIPKIKIGTEQTKPIEINITELPPEVAAETGKHIFIEAKLDIEKDEVYVQQQIPYTIKFYYDAAMQTGEVILPTIEDANLRVLGREKKYQEQRDGRNFVVVERKYVVSPEKSGELIIPPTLVQGRIAITNGDSAQLRKRKDETDMLNELFFDLNSGSTFSNPFDPFFSRRSIGPTRPFTVKSEALKINVLPVPAAFTGSAWLPTEDIKMQDSWAANPPTLKVGEPVSRSIIMQVKGLANSQIPEIEIPTPEGIKVYPEPAEGQERNDGNAIYGFNQTDITYIPSKAGNVTIPEIKVDWWDVKAKKQRTYILPKWNLNVAEGEVSAAEPESKKPDPTVETVEESEPDDSSKENIASDDKTPNQEEAETDNGFITAIVNKINWKNGLSLFVIISAMLWALYYLFKRNRSSIRYAVKERKKREKKEIQSLQKSLLTACKSHDNKAAASIIIEYAQLKFADSNIQNLGYLSAQLQEGAQVITELEASIYSAESNVWKGDKLHELIRGNIQLKGTNNTNVDVGLAPLYPN